MPSVSKGMGQKEMSSAEAPLASAASWIWVTAQDPRTIAEISPVASLTLDSSQLVVVGSGSERPLATMSKSRLSRAYISLPSVHGASSASRRATVSGPATTPWLPCHCESGQPSL